MSPGNTFNRIHERQRPTLTLPPEGHICAQQARSSPELYKTVKLLEFQMQMQDFLLKATANKLVHGPNITFLNLT